jgi:membrane-bound lytic murein transglycosylase D
MPNYTNHPSVQRFIRHYASDRARLNRITNRASKYLFHIVIELERRGMPTELALLPFVESAYVNTARSHAAAAGMWQFIPETGRRYGLKQRRGFDGRMDSFEATRAALDYLQKLNRQFNGDWFLSLAAYNAGEGRVARAIKYNRSRGRPTNYWNLRLPKETREYVPRLLAYKEIIRNPRRYGIQLPRAASRPVLTSIWLNRAVDLRQAARRAGLPANILTELNPSYLHGITTPRLSKRVILPVNLAGRLQQVLQRMPTVRDSGYRYAKYSKKKYSKRYKKRSKTSKKRVITHRVRRGETLYKIAVRHGTTVKKIMRMNRLRSSRVRAGKHLRVASRRASKRYS